MVVGFRLPSCGAVGYLAVGSLTGGIVGYTFLLVKLAARVATRAAAEAAARAAFAFSYSESRHAK
jgi:hypothetical protein